jgi:hypothetical protein
VTADNHAASSRATRSNGATQSPGAKGSGQAESITETNAQPGGHSISVNYGSDNFEQPDFDRENRQQLVEDIASGIAREIASPVTDLVGAARAAADGEYLKAGVGLAGAGCNAVKLCKAIENTLGAASERLKRMMRRQTVPNGTPAIDLRQTGSYTNTHASGATYSGKGSRLRSQQSGRRQARQHDDPHVATDWTPAQNDRDAFIQESLRIDQAGGVSSPSNYNRIESPGRRFRIEDGDL